MTLSDSPPSPPRSPAHRAVLQGDIKGLQACLAAVPRGCEAEALSHREEVLGRTLMHLACEHGHLHIAEYLVQKDVDLSCPDNKKVTPLHLAAAQHHNLDIVRLLLREGAYVQATDLHGELPLHWAASKGNLEAIRLLSKKTGVSVAGPSGWTPLHKAAHGGHALAVDALLHLGAFPNCRNKDGNTALHLACADHQLAVMEVLLGHGCSVDVENERGDTPLQLCTSAEARQLCGDERWKLLREQLQQQQQQQEQQLERQEERPTTGLFRLLSMRARKWQVEEASFPDPECAAKGPPQLAFAPRHRSMIERSRKNEFLETCLEPVSELRQARTWQQGSLHRVLDEMEEEQEAPEKVPVLLRRGRGSLESSGGTRPNHNANSRSALLPLIRHSSIGNSRPLIWSIDGSSSSSSRDVHQSEAKSEPPNRADVASPLHPSLTAGAEPAVAESPAPASERKICAYLNLSSRLSGSSAAAAAAAVAAAESGDDEEDELLLFEQAVASTKARQLELAQLQDKEWLRERREKEKEWERKEQALERERRHREKLRLKEKAERELIEREQEKERERELKEQGREMQMIRQQHRAWEKEAERAWEAKRSETRVGLRRKSVVIGGMDAGLAPALEAPARMRRGSAVCLTSSMRRPSLRVSFDLSNMPLHSALSSPGDPPAPAAPPLARSNSDSAPQPRPPPQADRGAKSPPQRSSLEQASLWSSAAAIKSFAATVASMHCAPTPPLAPAAAVSLLTPEPPSHAPAHPTIPRPGRHLVLIPPPSTRTIARSTSLMV